MVEAARRLPASPRRPCKPKIGSLSSACILAGAREREASEDAERPEKRKVLRLVEALACGRIPRRPGVLGAGVRGREAT